MSGWKNIQISKNNVEYGTGRSVLIKMPHKSKFDGYAFWHPAKCVHNGNNNYAASVGYTDSWEFKLKKYGKGKYNKHKVIDEITATTKDIEEAFASSQDSTKAPDYHTQTVEVTEPEYKKPEETKVAEALKCD